MLQVSSFKKTLNDYLATSYRMEIVEDKDEARFLTPEKMSIFI